MNQITYNEIHSIANNYLVELDGENIGLMLLEEYTKEITDGYIFFYQSKDYIETGDDMHLLYGNAPFLVNKFTKKITLFGTAMNVDYYIEEYEKGNLI